MIYKSGMQVGCYMDEDMKKYGNQELYIDYVEIDDKQVVVKSDKDIFLNDRDRFFFISLVVLCGHTIFNN